MNMDTNQRTFLFIIYFIAVFGVGYISTTHYLNTRSLVENRISVLEERVETLQQKVLLVENTVVANTANLQSEISQKENERIQVQEKLSSIEKILQKPDSAKAIANWRARVGRVRCVYNYGIQSYGSGVIISIKNASYSGVGVLSNKHVLSDLMGNVADLCIIEFPELDETVTGFKINNSIGLSNSGFDFGFIRISQPSVAVLNTFTAETKLCTTKASIGTPVVIIGYPVTGARENITATEGIVSGYENNFYITSAKVEQGNSGGIAVNVKENCMLGIPTYSNRGILESLARILDIRVLGI